MKIRNLLLSALMGISVNTVVLAEESPPPNIWPSYVEGLIPLGERMADQISEPKDPLLRQEMYKYMYEIVAQGYFTLLYQDTRHPDFWPVFNQAYPVGFANPDDAYYQAVVDDTGVYKISGFRGTSYIVDFQVGSGEFSPFGRGKLGPTLSNYDLDHEAHFKKDGSFEVILSPERPKGYKGDWWRLKPTATFIWVRQMSYDWVHEVDGRFAIERLDTPAIKPRDNADKIAEQLKQIPQWTQAWVNFGLHWSDQLRAKGLINKVAVFDWSNQGGVSTQRYIQGIFDIQPDEALIIETEIPKPCKYWAFQLANEQTDTIDWINRQSTLNGHFARLDKDGKFRAVISAKDPGVPNWLDVADYQRGLIVGRWKECASYPEPTVQKVKVADVRKYLPKETPVVTLAERDAHIRVMRKAVQLRRRW